MTAVQSSVCNARAAEASAARVEPAAVSAGVAQEPGSGSTQTCVGPGAPNPTNVGGIHRSS